MPVPHEPYSGGAQYDIRDQYGRIINNAEQQYYYQHVQYVQQARESFLREVAATRTKARVLVWLGLLISVAGFAVYAGVILRFIQRVPTFGPDTSPDDIELLGPMVLGVPIGIIAFAAAGIGSIMIVVGIVLHVVASARRRRVDRDLPIPARVPPPGYGPYQSYPQQGQPYARPYPPGQGNRNGGSDR
jgi:hypothetical protein